MVYAGLYRGGIFKTTDGGNTWAEYSAGLWLKSMVPVHVRLYMNRRIFYLGAMGTGSHANILR